MAVTPATLALTAAGVVFEITEYEPPDDADGHGDALVRATGLDPAQAAKTLVVLLDDRPAVAVVPIAGSLDLKALARAGGVKRASLAAPDDAERWTGSVLGGIAPLGHRRHLPAFVETTLTDSARMHVSGGRRGLEISLAPADLVAACDATVASIAR